MMGGDDIDKVLNKSQIEDIVHKSERPEPPRQQQQQQHEQQHEQQQKETWEDVVKKSEDITYSSIVSSATSSATSTSSVTVTAASASTSTANTLSEELKMTPAENVEMTTEVDVKEEEPVPVALEIPTSTPQETGPAGPSHHYSEELYDDANMEVKVDKSGKAKRDYSRTKKKDEKEFDMLLAIEKAQQDDNDLAEESFSDREYYGSEVEMKERNKEVKTPRGMGKSENERSSSPWTEEEDVTSVRHARRRLSTPATPNDSVPNSPVSSIYYNDEDRDYRNWKKAVMLVYSRVAANKYASLFSKPITDDQAPGYHSVVYRPMDLLTMRKHIENGTIRTTQEFQRDVLLMFNNAIMYNKTNGTVYNMARQMQQESLQQIQLFLQAQSQVDTPARRETRTSEPGLKRKRPAEDTNPNRSKKRKED